VEEVVESEFVPGHTVLALLHFFLLSRRWWRPSIVSRSWWGAVDDSEYFVSGSKVRDDSAKNPQSTHNLKSHTSASDLSSSFINVFVSLDEFHGLTARSDNRIR